MQTFGEWLQEFYTYKSKRVSASTLRNIGIVIRCHIPENLLNTPMLKITCRDLEQVIYSVQAERMRQCVYQVINEALQRAVTLSLIPANPMLLVEPIKHRQRKGMALSTPECNKLLALVPSKKLSLFFEFLIWSGCRRSEALALEWRDIDMYSLKLYIPGTKTEQSARTLPISKPLQSVISRLQDVSTTDKIFNYSADYVSKQFKKHCPRHKLHDLRHTFATICLESGIAIRVVQKWLGHTSIDTTARIYTHVIDDFQRQEANKLHI